MGHLILLLLMDLLRGLLWSVDLLLMVALLLLLLLLMVNLLLLMVVGLLWWLVDLLVLGRSSARCVRLVEPGAAAP